MLIVVFVQVMDGLEATTAIRKRENEGSRPRIPIIAVTAHSTQAYMDQCLAVGMQVQYIGVSHSGLYGPMFGSSHAGTICRDIPFRLIWTTVWQ